MMKTPQEIKDRFDGLRGREYDSLLLAVPHFNEFKGIIAREISDYAKNGTRILELGTGTGYTLKPVVDSLADKQIKIYALDISADDLSFAKKRIKDDSRVSFVAGDIFKLLPLLATNSFDVICTGWTLHNFKPKEREFLFKEIKRILKKGGLFVNGDRFAYDNPEQQTISIKEQLTLYQKHMPEHLCKGWSEHIIEDEKWKFTESEQLQYFPNGAFVFRMRNEGVFAAINI